MVVCSLFDCQVYAFSVLFGDCRQMLGIHYRFDGVEVVSNQVMGEMVLDGGGHFIPAGIDGFHTLSLFLASLVAYDRAKENNHIHTGKEHKSTNTIDTQ